MPDSLVVAQKILSCVLRLKQRFGGDYTAAVLIGSTDERIVAERPRPAQHLRPARGPSAARGARLDRATGRAGLPGEDGEFDVLRLTERGLRVLKGEEVPRLLEPAAGGKGKQTKLRTVKKRGAEEDDEWEGVDEALFESLRALRKQIADKKHVPAYAVFSDRALRGMARQKPKTPAEFLQVKGVGQTKCRQYAETFLAAIRAGK